MADSKMKEALQVQKWQDRISVSRRWRDQIAEENNWEGLLNELKNKYDVVMGNSQVPPIAEMFAYKDAVLANLYYRDPYLAVNARKNATTLSAYILEAGVNHLWNELKIKDDVELELVDGLFVGHGWNKVGNSTKTSGSGNDTKLVSDSIYSSRVSWRDMYMNVGCKVPTRDNLWIAQRIFRPTEDVKKDYPHIASQIKGSPYPSIDIKYMKNLMYKEDFNYTAIYEIWDAHEQKVYKVADEVMNKYAEDPKPWPSYLKEYPYQFLSFHNIPDEPYPQSEVGQFDPQVKEKIKIFTMILNTLKRWNRQMVIRTGTMGLKELDKFEKGIEGSILQAKASGNLQDAFKMLDWGSMPPDFFLILDRLDALIRKINGMPEFAYGGTPKTSTRTEGELQLIKGGADARTERKQDRLETHCENIARNLIFQMKNNFDVPYFASVTGKEPPEIIEAFKEQGIYDEASKTIKFSKKEIQGEHDVFVKAGSTLPLNKETRDQILNKVYEMSVPLAQAPSVPPFIAEIVKELLKDYDMQGLEAAFEVQEKATAQKQQAESEQADINDQKTMAETAKRNAQAQNVQIDSLIKGVQASGKATGILSPEESLT